MSEPAGDAANAEMIAALREFLDRVAPAAPDPAAARALAGDLRAWSLRLAPMAVEEDDPRLARRRRQPGGDRLIVPPLYITHDTPDEVRGAVTFGRAFLGANGVTHGGMIPLLFDDVLGRIANSCALGRARTAYIHVDYRSVARIDVELNLRAWLDRIEGRKRFIRGELRHGDVLCAECEGLFVELKPGMP